MKIKGTPDLIVTTTARKFGRTMRVNLFRFDSKGFAELDESKFSKVDLNKIKSKFEVMEKTKAKKPELSDDEIRQLAKTKGIKSWHVKSIETLLKELAEVENV